MLDMPLVLLFALSFFIPAREGKAIDRALHEPGQRYPLVSRVQVLGPSYDVLGPSYDARAKRGAPHSQHPLGILVMSHFSSLSLILAAVIGSSATPAYADAPVRIDLSDATGRGDSETLGWDEWETKETAEARKKFGGVTVTLRPATGTIKGFLNKRGLATGATIASDGVTTSGPLEVTIEGLPAGRHSLVTYHNDGSLPNGQELTLAALGSESVCTPSRAAAHDDDAATNYVEFDVEAGVPVVVTLRATANPEGGGVVLNGVEIDGPDPRRKAKKPVPFNFDEHSDGESGHVDLAWHAPESARKFHVYVTHHRDWNHAEAEARSATSQSSALVGETDEPRHRIKVDAHDSLEHYCWRVDTIGEDGAVTRGDVWSFRVRCTAFPGAEGYGRFAIGGRGGKVLHVTNLNDSGPGSLRAALEAKGARTVVFEVSGRIVLKDRLIIRDDYITIAGQTAPSKGICVSNYNLGMLGVHDAIIRYVRVRPGDASGQTLDGMGMASSDHSIIDHCSISWTQDEAFSSRGAKNITLQRTLISEALNVAGHRKYEAGKAHGYAASIGGDIGSFHHNLLAHCAGRNWSLAGSVDQANIHAGRLDIRNNVVYNWGHRTTDGGAKQVEFVNNYYKPGAASSVFHLLKPERNHAFGPQDYYVSGNVMVGHHQPSDPLSGVVAPPGEPLSEFVFDEPFWASHVDTQPAHVAYRNVLDDVGCNVPMLDDHDRRVIRETRRGTTTYKGSRSGAPGLPDSQEDVGGWEEYPEVHRPEGWDTDRDGMPDSWETQNGLDPNDPADGAQDSDRDGYTNLEEYLNELAAS